MEGKLCLDCGTLHYAWPGPTRTWPITSIPMEPYMYAKRAQDKKYPKGMLFKTDEAPIVLEIPIEKLGA